MVGDNMQFIYGSLGTVVFFVCLGGAYFLGMRAKKPRVQTDDDDMKEKKRKAKAMQDHFASLMNYDVDKATRKKVI